MIKRIIHCGDIHIPMGVKRHEEYKIVLNNFITEVENIVSGYNFGEVVLLIAGDFYHNKLEISNELNLVASEFYNKINKILPTIQIAGNHDYMENNKSRLDSITSIIKMLEHGNVRYLDLILDYKSGIIYDENIAWCLYSIFDDYKKPNVLESKIDHPDKLHIGLFHGCLDGSELDSTHTLGGLNKNMFEGCDLVLMADIHKRQFMDLNGVTLCYCGSLHQNHFGESVSKHGFIEWNIEDPSDITYEEHDLESLNEYGFYKFKINSIEEVEEGLEEFINF